MESKVINLDIINSEARSLRSEKVRREREAMLTDSHIEDLTHYVENLKLEGCGEVPYFDPMDGGVDAQVLFLFEKPGPATSLEGKHIGSGFISRDNDDLTAQETKRFMLEIGLNRKLTVLWNTIPWWNKYIVFTAAERKKGFTELEPLLALLPKLRVIVLVGKTAGLAESSLRKISNLPIVKSAHPSPKVRATRRKEWDEIPHKWAEVFPYLFD